MKHSLLAIPIFILLCILGGCIEDGITTSASDQPEYSTDTLDLGLVFTDEGSPTHSFKIYNRHDKIIVLSSVTLRSGEHFRMNVDGFSGQALSNIEIRPNDSIFVFVEATLPSNGGMSDAIELNDYIDITANGRTSTIVLRADGQDVERLHASEITTDTHLTAAIPYQIFDSLVVRPGATLTIDPGARLYFHDGAEIRIYGTLHSEGTAASPVIMRGDRHGSVVGSIDFNIMPSQWNGIFLYNGSADNRLAYTSIINTSYGLIADSLGYATDHGNIPPLRLTACRLHNSSSSVLTAYHTDVVAEACEFSDAPLGVVTLLGGNHRLNRCTVANTYIFSVIQGSLIAMGHVNEKTDDTSGLPYTTALITNSIISGNGSVLTPSDVEGCNVVFHRCLFSTTGTDDDNFIECLWDTDPLYAVDRENYVFDYRLMPDSPAAESAYSALDTSDTPTTDYYGTPLSLTLGAFGITAAE